VFVRANDDIRLRTGYDFESSDYNWQFRFTNSGEQIIYNDQDGFDYGRITPNLFDEGVRGLTLEGENQIRLRVASSGSELILNSDGDLIFPDNTVQTTAFTKILSTEDYIAGTQPVGIATGLIVTNNPQTNLIESSQNVNASGINFTLAIDGSGIATVTNIINGGTGQFVGKTFTVSGTAFFTNEDPPTFGTSPEDDIEFEVTAIDLSSLAVLDLTKSVQKLTDGYYSLANGTEGQIMYFVPETGVTEGSSINILMANVRQFSGGTATVQNNNWFPFFQNAIMDSGGETPTPAAFGASTIAYAIFTDGAWNVFGGGMD
jgi:hypothetical protein